MNRSKRPNILFILADDMGYGDLSAFNGGLSKTPALDNLLDESVCFTQHYAASPVCNPSRACLLTGRYPHRTGSVDTLEWRGLERLALRETTIADILKKEGYATGLVGKWHLGSFDKRYHPNARGFDEAACFRGGMHSYYNWKLEYDDKIKRADGRYLTDVWTDEACRFIDRHQNEPFFLHLTYNAPHTPLQAPEDDYKLFADTGKFNKGLSTLYAMIYRMDKGIARVLDKLKTLGLEDNTIVLFSSDNGPQFSGKDDALNFGTEEEMCTERFNCQFNGSKGSVYEGGIRVPMIVRWPAGLEKGVQIDQMAHFSDWFPTILAMAGVEKPQDSLPIDGVNILPVLRGDNGKVNTKRFWQWNRYSPVVTSNSAIRDDDWKLIRPVIPETMQVDDIHWLMVCMYESEHFLRNGIIKDPAPVYDVPYPPKPELYNIAEDPFEKNNLIDKYPDKAKKMLCELENWFEQVETERSTIKD